MNTGFATRNNNDHVLSFDGTMMGISHHSADDNGRSVIYTLPSTGGTPKRITANSPSYLHGWSPDKQVADLHRPAQQRARHLQDLRRRRRRDSPDDGRRRRRRVRVHAGRPVDLLQLHAHRPDADLEDEAGRHRADADHERRVQQLVPAHRAGRQVDGDHLVRRRTSRRATTRSTSTSTCATWQLDGSNPKVIAYRLRRPRHDQRAVVVAGRQADRVREQHGAAGAALTGPRRLGEISTSIDAACTPLDLKLAGGPKTWTLTTHES